MFYIASDLSKFDSGAGRRILGWVQWSSLLRLTASAMLHLPCHEGMSCENSDFQFTTLISVGAYTLNSECAQSPGSSVNELLDFPTG
jgi:hypothetical protein